MLDKIMAPYTALGHLVDGGGPFVFLIFVSGVIMWTLVIERIWYFKRVLASRESRRRSTSGTSAATTSRGARGRSAKA